MQQPLPSATLFDRIAFLAGAAAALWLAAIIAIQGVRTPWALFWFIPVWAILAYLILPRLHRMLSDLYVPDYFFGRTRTADGLLGDPVNLAVDGSAAQLDQVMTVAGWHRADEITAASTWRIITSTLTRRSYPTAPVSPLMLFGRRHDIAYQQEVAGNPKQRHHVRFWHCPPGWLLPGGAKVGWLGAGTYDTDVGISFFTLQVTHRIDQNTDVERDYVVASTQGANPEVSVRILRDFTTGYHSRNGGGDQFITDGDLPIIDLLNVSDDGTQQTLATEAARSSTSVAARAPLSTIVAVAIVALVAAIQLIDVFGDGEVWQVLRTQGSEGVIAIIVVLGIYAAMVLAQLLMAVQVLRRGRRARAVLMALLVISILLMAIDYLDGTAVLGLDWTLLTASVQCIALLALSSESSGAWARRKRRHAEPEAVEARKIAGWPPPRSFSFTRSRHSLTPRRSSCGSVTWVRRSAFAGA
ncbi:membrane protein [Microbacterium sp. CH12i]|nr:membrane protein [Microbacterium sp. CH12i]